NPSCWEGCPEYPSPPTPRPSGEREDRKRFRTLPRLALAIPPRMRFARGGVSGERKRIQNKGEPFMKRLLFLVAAAGFLGVCPACAADKNPVVVMETSMGPIKIELYPDKAPITVKNFLGYVDDKFYDGPIFHRVISDFMIQGGGLKPGLEEKKGTKGNIKNEAANGLSNARGTIAMARMEHPDSASAQFFINVKENKHLDRT